MNFKAPTMASSDVKVPTMPSTEKMKEQLAEQKEKLEEEIAEMKDKALSGIQKCFATCMMPAEIKEKINKLNEKKAELESRISAL